MKEKFQNPQTVIRWLFAGFTVICLLAAVLVSDRGGMLDGLVRICTQSGQTVKSYFDPSYGGFSGTFLMSRWSARSVSGSTACPAASRTAYPSWRSS